MLVLLGVNGSWFARLAPNRKQPPAQRASHSPSPAQQAGKGPPDHAVFRPNGPTIRLRLPRGSWNGRPVGPDGTWLGSHQEWGIWTCPLLCLVPAGSLTIGEHLRTESGTLRQVTRITPRRGPPVAVFNLEVDAEHVYYVSTAGVLVHNAYSGNAPNRGPYRGGSHADMSGPRTRRDGLDSHHMPDRHATPTVDPNDGPAIQMDPLDHFATSSNGRHGESSRIWRDETAQMIREGRYRDAMAREIRDVRRAAKKVSSDPRKYNEAIQEMLEYARRTGQLPARN